MSKNYFFDTYALFEYAYGNPRYTTLKPTAGVITAFNLAEFNYVLKRKTTSQRADEITTQFAHWTVNATLFDILSAMTLRHKYKGMSIPDAIGYTVAKRLGILFLTGDDDFKTLANVEFVKK